MQLNEKKKKVLKNLKANEWWQRGHMSNFFMGKG